MTFWIKQNYGDNKKIIDLQGLGGGWLRRAQRILEQWNYSIWNYDGQYMSLYVC